MQHYLDAARLSVKKAARRVRVHPSTVWRWILAGTRGRKLRRITIGARRFILVVDLEAFVAQGLESPASVAHCGAPENRAQTAADELTRRGV